MYGTDWDSRLPDDLVNSLRSICEAISSINEHTVPRHIGLSVIDEFVELHAFADASPRAYASCIYLKVRASTKLLLSKSRLAPKKVCLFLDWNLWPV